MPDESYGFTKARTRLEEIVSAVRKKDTSLEKSLDLLEEGVRLANQCTEMIDHADWEAAGTGEPIVADADAASTENGSEANSSEDVEDADGSEDRGDEPEGVGAGSDEVAPEGSTTESDIA
jgi:exodeoxyribonuclease VII small subunit